MGQAQDEVLIIGAGVGGLSAAIRLAAAGVKVRVLEAQSRPGGKLGEAEHGGLRFDTGPSLLTLPQLATDLLALGGPAFKERLQLRPLSPAFRYLYPDGAVVETHHHFEATLASVRESLGPRPARELEDFLAYAGRIWDAAAGHFVFTDAPSFGGMLTRSWRGLLSLPKIDAHHSMLRAIEQRIRSPHLRSLLMRFATYNGSDVRRAPATLNCIAHVDLALGGFGVEGGMFALAEALEACALSLGVRFDYGARVRRVCGEAPRFEVELEGESAPRLASQVVFNADVSHVLEALMPETASRIEAGTEASTSGVNAVFAAPPSTARAAHTVLFPTDYLAEFEALFDQQRVPEQPTVYLCDQHLAHGRRPSAEGAVPLFTMVNAPALQAGTAGPDLAETVGRIRQRLEVHGLLDEGDACIWQRGPAELAATYPGSRGALYGAASNDPFTAFKRPPNHLPKLPGVYFASGSAHPGGGVPMCLQSGALAAKHLLEDRSSRSSLGASVLANLRAAAS